MATGGTSRYTGSWSVRPAPTTSSGGIETNLVLCCGRDEYTSEVTLEYYSLGEATEARDRQYMCMLCFCSHSLLVETRTPRCMIFKLSYTGFRSRLDMQTSNGSGMLTIVLIKLYQVITYSRLSQALCR